MMKESQHCELLQIEQEAVDEPGTGLLRSLMMV